jgi:hypothetical protein
MTSKIKDGTMISIKYFAISSIVIWFMASLIAGGFDLFSQPGVPPINVGIFFLCPILFFTILYLTSSKFRVFTKNISLSLIVGAHTWRYVGLGFVIAYFLGYLPAGFGIPEGLGDIITAVFAIPLAIALNRGKPVRKFFIVWNIFGLLDLISAIIMGILYSEGSLGVLNTDVSTALMTTFPVNIIPTFFVPLFIMLHILALVRYKEVRPQ